MAGSVTVVIGPNGYGKTHYLEEKQKELIEKHGSGKVLYIPSEIKLLDEVKDTVDTSQTMEFLMSELIETEEYRRLKGELFAEADRAIAANSSWINDMVGEVFGLNGSSLSRDFISPGKKRLVKGVVGINQAEVKSKLGSGQKMQLLLALARNSSKEYILLDEPEKYSHPSLLNGTARAIMELMKAGHEAILATHSPKLVSMLEIDYGSILLINDSSHTPKRIPFDEAVAKGAKRLNVGALQSRFKRYYTSGGSLSDSVMRRHGRSFIESLFTKHVYLCEGANDEIFLNAALMQFGGYYEDYCIVKTWGKSNLPVFIALYEAMDIDVTVLFDADDESKRNHREVNEGIRDMCLSRHVCIEFAPCLEKAIGYEGKKEDALALMDHLEGYSIPSSYNPNQHPRE